MENEVKPAKASAGYPTMPLKEAAEKARLIYEADGRRGSDRETAVNHMGYSSLGGASRAALSTLRKFGLVEYRDSRVIPTPYCIDLVIFTPEQPEFRQAARAAALTPDIYKSLWDLYAPDGRLPSDLNIRQHLIREREFTPKAADAFVEDFKSSLEWAGLLKGNKFVTEDEDEQVSHESGLSPGEVQISKGTATVQPIRSGATTGEVRHQVLSIFLGPGRGATLSTPSDLAIAEVDVLVDYLHLLRRTLERTTPDVRLGKAIWRTKLFEQPVTVKRYAGTREGIHFVEIEETATAVPMNELVYVD